MDKLTTKRQQQNELGEFSKRSTGNKITLANCIEEKNLFKLVREHGEEPIAAALLVLITEKMELFNIKYRISDVQISFLVDCYLQDFKSETLADLGLCLNNAAKGKYGPIYNVIDPPTVLGWFRQHLDEKAQEREKQKKAVKFDQEVSQDILDAMKNAIKDPEGREHKGARHNHRDQYIKQVRQNLETYDQKTLKIIKKEFSSFNYERFYPGIMQEIEQYIN